MHLLHLPFPSLTSLELELGLWDLHKLQSALEPFAEFSPNIGALFLTIPRPVAVYNKFVSHCICQWRNLKSVICPQITLDMDALLHLSGVSALSRLDIMLPPTLPSPDTTLPFPNLHELQLHSSSLAPIAWLFSHACLPVVTGFVVVIDSCPSKQEFTTFLAGVQTSGAGDNVLNLRLDQQSPPTVGLDSPFCLCLDYLRPCMPSSRLRFIEINIKWDVYLTNNDVLSLASACPKLHTLCINERRGWNTNSGGITPNGLLQLLQTCQDLT